MSAIANTVVAAIHLPRWVLPRLPGAQKRRKQATVDLIHSSPHLLRDIGVTSGHFSGRHK